MADEGAVAVAEAPVVDAGAESFVDTPAEGAAEQVEKPEQDKLDGRRQPDALRKRIAGLKSQAESTVDPAEKASLLADAQALTNSVGKVGAYEKVYPTVREARETKALVESFGGREGLAKTQETLARVTKIDNDLAAGNPVVAKSMWDEAPQGMPKVIPALLSEFEQRNPQEYEKAVVPHAVKFFDKSGFPEAFDQMVELYQAGNKEQGDALAKKLAQWFSSQRQGTRQTETKPDPRVEEAERKLQEREEQDKKQATDRAYNDIVAHAVPVLDKHLRAIVGKLGLSKDQMDDLREAAWAHLQSTRNADPTYKTVATAKYAQGMDAATAYIKSETEARALDAARAVANKRYGHQLKNGAVKTPNVTATPITPGITRGKEPLPSEIDYGPKGIQAAKKNGFKDLSDMILAGKAPLKVGGIRQWR